MQVKIWCRSFLLLCFAMLSVHLLAQQRLPGKYLPQYRLFVPQDSTGIFVKRFSSGAAVYMYKNESRLKDGLLVGKCGLIDTTGLLLTPAIYDRIRIANDTLFMVQLNGKEGLINLQGKVVLTPKYDYMGLLCNGKMVVSNDGKFGYIDVTGKVCIPLVYDLAFDYYNGFFHVKSNHTFGLLNAKGDTVLPPVYQYIRPYGRFIIARKGGKCGLLDKQGKLLLDFEYDALEELNSDSIVSANVNRESWVMNWRTKAVLSKKYHSIYTFGVLDSIPYYRAQKNGKKALIDQKGELMSDGFYDEMGIYYEQLANVSRGNKQGFIDATGKLVIPLIYDRVWRFKEGFCLVILQGKTGFIDKKGKLLFTVPYTETGFFENGLAQVFENKKMGFINTKGKLVIPIQYDWGENFKAGTALVHINQSFFYITEAGGIVR